MARSNRMTAYDVMEARGVFARNPANPDSRSEDGESLYTGPVRFPQMFYHPEGLERILVPGELVTTRDGQAFLDPKTGAPRYVGEQKEIIWRLAQDETEAEDLIAAGWHEHPAQALKAAGRPAPPMGAQSRMTGLEAEVARLKARLKAVGEDEDVTSGDI